MKENCENDWTRTAKQLNAIHEQLLDGTHGVLPESDSVTVKTDTWVATILELRRAQTQCADYGKMQARYNDRRGKPPGNAAGKGEG